MIFGGTLPTQALPVFEAILSDCCQESGHFKAGHLVDLDAGALYLFAYFANDDIYCTMDRLGEFCQLHNITFDWQFRMNDHQNDSVELSRTFWTPGMAKHVFSAAVGRAEPAVTLTNLVDAQTEGQTLDQIIAKLKLFNQPVPPFALIKEPASDPA